MSLPWLVLQTGYAHFAWAMVLSACGVGLLAWKKPLPMRLAAAWVVLVFAVCAMPGSAAPSYWLGLAFALPSPLLLAFCAMAIWQRTSGSASERVLPLGLAAALMVVGAVLYADTTGWLSLGLYPRGFGHEAAVAGLLVGVVALLVIGMGPSRGAGLAVLLSLLLFSLSRLPTGNVWDALIDPWLWLWALFSLLGRGLARLRLRRA